MIESLIKIYIANRNSFNDFSTGKITSICKRILFQIILSIILSIFFQKISTDFINGVIAIYSILVGFSYNILFNILTLNKNKDDLNDHSLESRISYEKLKKLSIELFHNVTYFNIISIFIILKCVFYFTYKSISIKINYTLFEFFIYKFEFNIIFIIKYIWGFLFYFLIVESMYTFIRTVIRLNYFFEKKII